MNIVYKIDTSQHSNTLNRKETVNENKPVVSIMDFITMIYNL